jgi:hypothetical protein
MRLFHVSEDESIEQFEPRRPTRQDLDQNTKLVWAINEARLVNFLTPRDCPRVTFYATPDSTPEDIDRYIGNTDVSSVIAIERAWFRKMQETRLTIYEFDPTGFILQDAIAGYYVSDKIQVPIGVTTINDLYAAIFARNAELRVLPNLWSLCNTIKSSSLGYSMCRMRNAIPER